MTRTGGPGFRRRQKVSVGSERQTGGGALKSGQYPAENKRYARKVGTTESLFGGTLMTWMFWPLVVWLVSLSCFIAILYGWSRLGRRRRDLAQLATGLLRAPGLSLRQRLDESAVDLAALFAVPGTLPLALYAFHLAGERSGRVLQLNVEVMVYGVLALCLLLYIGYELARGIERHRRLRLGLDAELAVAQELNRLMREGYWVFHDLTFEGCDIDHVVVGRNGVFAVETKSRMRPMHKGRLQDKVECQGIRLCFPGWSEHAPLEQSQRQANVLRDWLTSAAGEPVPVKGVLALPGWDVRCKGLTPVPAFNGKQCSAFFRAIGRAELSDPLVTRIVHALDRYSRHGAVEEEGDRASNAA